MRWTASCRWNWRFAGRLPFLLVEASCDEATARRRLRNRKGRPSISDAGVAVREKILRRYEPIEEFSATEHVLVDTTTPRATWLAGLMARLRV